MPLTVFDVNSIPGTRRERIETAVARLYARDVDGAGETHGEHHSEWPRGLPPFSLQDKRAPIIWRRPSLLFPHRDLGLAERGGGALAGREHRRIEPLHSLRRHAIVDAPEGG